MRVLACAVCSLLLFLVTYGTYGQQQEGSSKIVVIGRAEADRIRLRWAPNSHTLWQRGNKSGYTIDKYLLVRNRNLLTKPEKHSTKSLQVRPAEGWKPLAQNKQTERYAAIALQAIYGANFTVQSTASNNFNSVMTGVQEQEMRYSFAMMSADYSFDVAEAMGVGFLDKDVKKDEKYLYKVYVNLPKDSGIKQDTAFIFIGLEDVQKLPQPVEVNVQFGNSAATISWNTMYHEHIYTGYSIERSEDGVNFRKLSEIPITRPVKATEAPDSKYIYKTDSLPSNSKTYYYRVVGHTPFGDSGPPSAVVKGQGSEALSAMPLLDAPTIDEKRVTITWRFMNEQDKSIALIKGFVVEKSSVGSTENYVPVHAGMVDAKMRSYTDTLKEGSFFYRLKIVDKNNKEFFTFPQMVKTVDIVPPAIPTAIVGKADSLGKVTLQWENVRDKDLLGYKVFRSNHKNTEFSLITGSPISDSVFVDQIEIKTLSSEIYYKVAAIDQNYNHSDYSEPVTIVKPDLLPPVPPVLRTVEYDDNRVKLHWTNSSSKDVTAYHIYRKEQGDQEWMLAEIVVASDSISSFWDDKIESGKRYSYSILAVDKSKLESSPSNALSVLIPKVSPKPTGLMVEVNKKTEEVTLQWDQSNEVKYYWVYRSTNEGGLAYYKRIESVNSFSDKINPANEYKYRLKAFFKKDLPPVFSDEVVVKLN